MNPDTHSVPAPSAEQPKKTSVFGTIRFVAIWLVVIVAIRLFIAQPFIVDGASMVPNFADKDYLIVDEISYRFHAPERGDVVIFQYPCPNITASAGSCPTALTFYIKRIIGLPGETVVYKPGQKVVIKNAEHPEGFELDDSYISEREPASTYLPATTTLAAGEYFVMGDNRPRSSDSRIWGVLPKDKIVGRPLVRLLPFSSIAAFPGEVSVSK